MNQVTDILSSDLIANRRPSGSVLDIVKSYRRHLRLFLAVAGGIFLVVALYTFTRTPRYSATTNIVVAPRKAEVGSDRSSPVSDPTADSSVDTQVEVLHSPALLMSVVDQLQLADDPRFSQLTSPPGLIDRLGLGSSTSQHEKLTKQQRRQAATDYIEHNLDVRRVAQTFVLESSFTTFDPLLTSSIVNALARNYVDRSLQVKLTSAGTAGRLLTTQLDRAREEVTAANSELSQYKIAHNLISLNGGTMAEQELTNFDDQVATAQAAESEVRARYATARQQLERGSNGEDVGEALGSPVIQELRKQRSEVARKVAENATHYGPRFPATAAGRQELASIDSQIHAEVRRIVSGLEAQTEAASRRAASLEASRAQTRASLASNNVASVRLGELQSRASAAQQLYEELLGRVREIGTQAATTQPDARIEDVAPVPNQPNSPNIPINLLVGLLLGIAGGVGAVVVRQGLDQTLSSLEDVESRLNLRYLAGLPTLNSSVSAPDSDDPVAAVLAHRRSAFTESFRSLAAAVLEGGSSIRTILLTSSVPNEGKTTAAICLARVLAMGGKRVLLVDADLRRPSVAAGLRLQAKIGTHELITGEASLDQVLVLDEASTALILPTVPRKDQDTSPIEDGQLMELIERLKTQFDIIVLDGSPILPVVDGRILAKAVDATIFLVRWRDTPEAAVKMALHLLSTVGATVSGVALSRVDLLAMAKSGYGDPAKYFHMYDNYYHS